MFARLARLARLAATAAMIAAASPAWAIPSDDVRARIEFWADQFNAKDAAGACDLYSADLTADFRGQPERGRAAICNEIRAALRDPARGYHYEVEVVEVIVEGELAVARVVRTLFITPFNVTSVERAMDVLRREADGEWRIVRTLGYEAP